MIKLMKLDELVDIAADAGIPLREVTPKEENLYVYATSDDDKHTLYVGKSEGEPGSRAAQEKNVAAQGYKERFGVGFSALVTENNAVRHSFHYDTAKFDKNLLLDHIRAYNWHTAPIEGVKKLLEAGPLSLRVVEQILIRIHVSTGRLIGNSHGASQWAGRGVNMPPNVIAVLAADISRESGKRYLLSDESMQRELAAEGII